MPHPRILLVLIIMALLLGRIRAMDRQPRPPYLNAQIPATTAHSTSLRVDGAAVESAQRLLQSVRHLESALRLPTHTLVPYIPYPPPPRQAVEQYLHNSATRLQFLWAGEEPTYSIFASSALWMNTGETEARETLWLFRIYPTGEIMLIGPTRVRPEVPLSGNSSLFSAIWAGGGHNWSGLQQMLNNRAHIVETPPQLLHIL
ncbi:uncharacterized protein MEPE_06107 [Melanopsichium pennsylvanicum]|uniref:Uncharacterized protein n=1 Tax=Melanopsichium pennsylvanicum TaxID=63383 RepID=A0AAJ4XS47_9BASI|nr:uncharacterized protein MEPE_06107 [Melanopsichium pennsylvanicum]